VAFLLHGLVHTDFMLMAPKQKLLRRLRSGSTIKRRLRKLKNLRKFEGFSSRSFSRRSAGGEKLALAMGDYTILRRFFRFYQVSTYLRNRYTVQSMKPTLLTFLFTMCVSLAFETQHCAFCGQHALVIRVTSSKDTNVISHLRLTVLDSTGQTVMTQKRVNEVWVWDTLRLRQNVKSSKVVTDKGHSEDFEDTRYWFARDNYYLIFYAMPGNRIKIEDTDGKLNGGNFKTTFITPSQSYMYPLCAHFSQWANGKEGGFEKGYKPLPVILK
jgi:hypothetical protein